MENHNDSKVGEIIVGVIVIALIAIGVSLLVSNDSTVSTTRTDDFTISSVNVAQAEGEERLPAGFPEDVPVELDDIEESYKVTYNDPELTQYTVSYYSFLTPEEKVEEYQTYMEVRGLDVEVNRVAEADLVNMSGTSDLVRMDVTVVPDGERTYVSISYIIQS